MKELLQNFTDQLLKIELFKKNNAKIFEDLERMEYALEQLREIVKEKVKDKKIDVENDVVAVKYIPSYKKFYDFDLFLDSASKKEIEILKKAKGIEQEINRDVFNELVKQGLISLETKQMCFRETEGAISIRFINKLIK
jgi:hypothetical protein